MKSASCGRFRTIFDGLIKTSFTSQMNDVNNLTRPRDSLDDAVERPADDLLHPLRVLLGHPLQPDAERRLLGAAVVPAQRDISDRRVT